MTLLLDTSAIIGWLEREHSTLPPLLEASGTALYHPVTLGELRAGIERASTDAEREMRLTTLNFTVDRLDPIAEHLLSAEHFGVLTARFTRKLSHNDYWIVAAAVASERLDLATEDRQLFDVLTSGEFADAVARRSWRTPSCALVTSDPVLA